METGGLLKSCLKEDQNDLVALDIHQRVFHALEGQPELQAEYEWMQSKIFARKLTYYQMEMSVKRETLEAKERRIKELEKANTVLESNHKRMSEESTKYQMINSKLLEEVRLENIFRDEHSRTNK